MEMNQRGTIIVILRQTEIYRNENVKQNILTPEARSLGQSAVGYILHFNFFFLKYY